MTQYNLPTNHGNTQPVFSADQNAIAAAINQSAEHNMGLFVASSQASAAVKASADYVCDGTGDEVEINAAIVAVGSFNANNAGGTVTLSEGKFWLQNPIAHHLNGITLVGAGSISTIIQSQVAGTTLTAHIIFGDTANVSRCDIGNLQVYGRRDAGSTTTGHGIVLRGKNSRIEDVHCLQCAGDGLHVESNNAGALDAVENILVNCYAESPANDGIVLTGDACNNELLVCRVRGGQVPASSSSMTLVASPFGRYGFNNAGARNKFFACHPYFCTWGFISTGGNLTIVGGEYETNQSGGIAIANGADVCVAGAMCYDNLGYGIQLGSGTGALGNDVGGRVVGNRIMKSNRGGTPTYGIYVYHGNHNVLADNAVSDVAASGYGIYLGGDSASNLVHDNHVWNIGAGAVGAFLTDSTSRNYLHDNYLAGGVVEDSASTTQLNLYGENWVPSGSVTLRTGGSSVARNTVTT